jgi:hypothetical protein
MWIRRYPLNVERESRGVATAPEPVTPFCDNAVGPRILKIGKRSGWNIAVRVQRNPNCHCSVDALVAPGPTKSAFTHRKATWPSFRPSKTRK